MEGGSPANLYQFFLCQLVFGIKVHDAFAKTQGVFANPFDVLLDSIYLNSTMLLMESIRISLIWFSFLPAVSTCCFVFGY